MVKSEQQDNPRPESYILWPRSKSGFGITIYWDIVHDRVEPVEITVTAPRGRSLSAELLRREIPFGDLIAEQRVKQRALATRAADRAPKLTGKQRHDALLPHGSTHEEVAAIYRDAHLRGYPPRKAVMDHYDIADSTAAKRIMAARKAGALGPARPGKAGEA